MKITFHVKMPDGATFRATKYFPPNSEDDVIRPKLMEWMDEVDPNRLRTDYGYTVMRDIPV